MKPVVQNTQFSSFVQEIITTKCKAHKPGLKVVFRFEWNTFCMFQRISDLPVRCILEVQNWTENMDMIQVLLRSVWAELEEYGTKSLS